MNTTTLKPKVNDFSLHVATVNGSGSQSSNNILIRSIFRMGIPVSGKNLFPSNIQGLPTWFTIRVCEDSWTARHSHLDIIVCMNDATFKEDISKAPDGSLVIHHDHMRAEESRENIKTLAVPFKKIITTACPEARLRKLAINMVYVGVLAELIGIDDQAIDEALAIQFKTKKKVIDLNKGAIEGGRQWAKENLTDELKNLFRLERRDLTKGKILMEGNAAAALGAIYGGCQMVSWYPITPSSSVAENFSAYAEKFRKTEDGKRKFAILQAEDELAAVGMVIGAGWMGGRAMTATSGPGISLMAEFTGLAYFAEIPAVIYDIQRVGPSTGLPTRTAQQDIVSAATLSHGDTKHVCLYPANLKECFDFGTTAFNLAEELQTPVFVLSDLDLGMNMWMSEPFDFPKEPIKRGKLVLDGDEEKLKDYGRYKDVDGDGICYRSLPGMKDKRGVFFTRGTGHDESARYTESNEVFKKLLDRLARKWKTAAKKVPESVVESAVGAEVGVVAFGSTHDAVREAVVTLEKAGVKVDYLRLRSFPFDQKLVDFLKEHQKIYLIEQNRDAQMRSLFAMEDTTKGYFSRVESVLQYDGLPITADFIAQEILSLESMHERKVS